MSCSRSQIKTKASRGTQYIFSSLDLEILLHVLTDHFDLEDWCLAEFVDNQVRVVSTKVVKEDRDLKTDRAL